jgi:hypothetical protein
MYAAAINRPSPTTPSPRVPIASALTGWSSASWPLPASAAATLAIPVRPAKGRHHRRCRSATGIQFDPQQASLPPTGDRDRPRRPTHREGAKGSYEVQGACGVLLAVCAVLGSGPGGFACPLDDRVFAPSSQDSAKVRLETVPDGLTPALPWVPQVERPSPCR